MLILSRERLESSSTVMMLLRCGSALDVQGLPTCNLITITTKATEYLEPLGTVIMLLRQQSQSHRVCCRLLSRDRAAKIVR
ncbi:hypothetical protein EJ03DRAFT_46765 [Teratosphaeria nubilosa]|uniref:Uncharacterized protein n=1 Tax=Teratosphaeria nubilosa TaxID=161662 RepID=A0A6G1LF09_9PEZI|nr:hypothetical protein EJ03DRAFT_46765 [Teratosphaeria nubilosa]